MKVQPKSEYEVAYHDLVDLCRKHAEKMSGVELLAVAANMLGKLLALQDQRLMPVEAYTDLIARNMQIGNDQAVAELMKSQSSA